MAFTAGTALSGVMQGFWPALQQMQRYQQQRDERGAGDAAWQALLGGALGGGNAFGGQLPMLPTGGAPPVPQPPMPGQASVPDQPAAAPVTPNRGNLIDNRDVVEEELPPPGEAYLPGAAPGRIKPGSTYSVPTGGDTPPASDAEAGTPVGGPTAPASAPSTPAPPTSASSIDLSRYFHQVDVTQLARAVQAAKPGISGHQAMAAVERLYKLGTSGDHEQRLYTSMMLQYLAKKMGLEERITHDRATEGAAQQRIGQGDVRLQQGAARVAQGQGNLELRRQAEARRAEAAAGRASPQQAAQLRAISAQISTVQKQIAAIDTGPNPTSTLNKTARAQLQARLDELAKRQSAIADQVLGGAGQQ